MEVIRIEVEVKRKTLDWEVVTAAMSPSSLAIGPKRCLSLRVVGA
jgi:hypothetical protein